MLGFIETFDLSPKGTVFWPELVPEIVQRYRFQKFPKALEEFDEQKGVQFIEGKWGDKVIQKVDIYNSLMVVETRSNTDDSKQLLEEMLLWGAAKFGLNYKSGMIKRWAYVSDVTVYSDVPLLNVSPVLSRMAERCSKALTDIWHEPVQYEPLNLIVGHDPSARKNPIAPFSITRRAESRFSDNKYFSEAPLPTDMHLALLQEYEAEVKRMHASATRK